MRVEVVPDDATYLLSEREVTALRAPGLEALAPLLDGTRDLAALQRELTTALTGDEVATLVAALRRAGLVDDRPARGSAPAPEQAAYWDLAGVTADGTPATVAVLAAGGADDRGLREALRTAGLAVSDTDGGAAADGNAAGLLVVVTDDYLAPELADVDARSRRLGRPWLLARPDGATAWLGPVLRPGDGPCWHCLAHRLRAHRMSEQPVRRALGLAGPVPRPRVSHPAFRGAALQLVALEAAKWLAGHRSAGQSAVRTLDGLALSTADHAVERRPQCPSCGDADLVAARARRPVEPRSRPKAAFSGGGHRALGPQEVLDRWGHLVSPVTGVVKEVRRDTRAPSFLHCYTSGRNLALGGSRLAELRAGLRAVSGGKGTTALEAEVSALCEALERYSGTLQGDEARVRDSARALGDEAVTPDRSLLFDARQYRDRHDWNARQGAFQQIPEPFDPAAPADWTPVWSLTERRHRLLPTGLLYFDPGTEAGVAPVAGSASVRADSNGSAAGSSLEDAILQGFLEVVERDAVALWWYNRTRMPAVDIASFGDRWAEELIGVYRELRREVWALDLTSDFGIPVFAALSRRTDKKSEDIMFGFGAHRDPHIALRRALTEMNQLMPAVVGAGEGDGYAVRDPELLRWWGGATVANQPYLLPDRHAEPARPGAFPAIRTTDLRADVTWAEETVRARGLDLLVLDQTRPDIGLPVVKVVVPGMRHFWARFAPGRLFDIPVSLGRLSEPTRFEELNPIPLFV
ncbi:MULTISPECIES: TOMM precursor leader peptide-binding protein [unclassified Streptomyces]|uniref:TOMM precursor leader peptide-binding protein n=1 Tax=unclassified Streptomyces TaxID=2593676 RepID=UPI001E40D6C6|nr:TOMM precursor leader peptide-binding protein [Streptomyces sp. CB02980]MCB8905964.1 TOMM precursor leader peptide-binding protein [Streptomyces sp. CB02980]